MIRFLLNREIRVEERLDPNLTVLDYLRRHLGKTGTRKAAPPAIAAPAPWWSANWSPARMVPDASAIAA